MSSLLSSLSVVVNVILNWYFARVLYAYYKEPEHHIANHIVFPNRRVTINGVQNSQAPLPNQPVNNYPNQQNVYQPGQIHGQTIPQPPPPIIEGTPVDPPENQLQNLHIYGMNQPNQNIIMPQNQPNLDMIAARHNPKDDIEDSEAL